MITVYHNAGCSKSNGVCELLAIQGIPFTTVDYLHAPLSKEQLLLLLDMLGMKASELVRRNEPLFIEKYADHEMNEEAYLQAMVDHPILIERPIVVKDGKAIIGRPVERVMEML